MSSFGFCFTMDKIRKAGFDYFHGRCNGGLWNAWIYFRLNYYSMNFTLIAKSDWSYHDLVAQVQRMSMFFDTYVVRRGILFDLGTGHCAQSTDSPLRDAQASFDYLQGRSRILG